MLAALRTQQPWTSLQRTYDVPALEAQWLARIEALTRWTIVYGDWDQAGDAMQTTTGERGGAAVLVHRERPLPGQPYSIRARLDSDPGDVIGFVVGYRDTDHHAIVVLRLAERRLVVAKRNGFRWSAVAFSDTGELPADWTLDDLTLRCDATGEITVAFGERELACHALGDAAFGGAVGLFVEPSLEQDGAGHCRARPVTYRYADVALW